MLKNQVHKDDISYGNLSKIVLPKSSKTETFDLENDPNEPAFKYRNERWILLNKSSWDINEHLKSALKRVQICEDGVYKKRVWSSSGAGNNSSKYFEEIDTKRAYEPASVAYAKSEEQRKNNPQEKTIYRRNGIFIHKSLNNLSVEKMLEASIDETINIRESTNVPNSTNHELTINLLDKDKNSLYEETINTSIKNESIKYNFKIENLVKDKNINLDEISYMQTNINIEHENVHIKEEKTIPIVAVREVVHFRPHSKYKGEYGFDWFRNGDTNLAGEKKYSYVLEDKTDLEKITKDYTEEKTIKRDNDKKYFIPKLTIYPNKKVILEIFNDKNKDNLEKIEYKSSTDKLSISKHAKGKYLKIISKDEFSSNAFIEAKLNGKLIGKLEVLANNDRKELDIIVIRVKMQINDNVEATEGKILSSDNKNLRNSLGQAYLKANIEEFDGLFNLVGDKGLEPYLIKNQKNKNIINRYKDLNDYLNPLFNKKFPEHKHKIKVFFINEHVPLGPNSNLLGRADDINSSSVIIYKKGNRIISHEVFHALGLYHTFSYNTKFRMKKSSTRNIMDYKKGNYFSFSWQWKKLQQSKLLRKEK
ncbi:MAG: hypothetical protein HRT42_08240 [Campylobacteraceae bacterium]|nr:hypothetical protein [Campylobacteraceae bacterium]